MTRGDHVVSEFPRNFVEVVALNATAYRTGGSPNVVLQNRQAGTHLLLEADYVRLFAYKLAQGEDFFHRFVGVIAYAQVYKKRVGVVAQFV